MIGEEIAINQHLESHGIRTIETDLGEYIIQLRRELPSHIVAPAIHLSLEDVAMTSREHHQESYALCTPGPSKKPGRVPFPTLGIRLFFHTEEPKFTFTRRQTP